MKNKNNKEQINNIKIQNNEYDKKENNIISEVEIDNKNIITIINEKDDKISHPEYYNDFVKIKFSLGEGMICKWVINPKTGKKVDNIKKYNLLKIEQNEQK